jgi:carboxyl-terminal processing protease
MAWGYSDGKTFSGESINSETIRGYKLKNINKNIAVLINNKTASSGEAIAVAFKGLPRIRFFGDKTCGLTTGNSSIALFDSSMIFLMTVVYADRDSTVYGIPIIPEEIVQTNDPKEVAINWINHNWTMFK